MSRDPEILLDIPPANVPARCLAVLVKDDQTIETLRVDEAPDILLHSGEYWHYGGTSDGIAYYNRKVSR